MANVTVAGASYTDVPAVELPTTGGGTSTFYEVSGGFKTVTQTLTNITSSADDTRVPAGNSFFTELTPSDGYYISSITVTMGGVDITDQVFKPGLGVKAITANGSYAAAADSLSGYSSVSVNVQGGGSPTLQNKTKTYTPATSTQTETVSADVGYDGLSGVNITVNPIPGQYIVPTGTKSITANGTNIDVTSYASVDVAVPTGGGAYQYYKTGTYTPDADKKSTANVEITTLATVGFTPKKFFFYPTTKSDVSGKQYAVIFATFDEVWPIRFCARYTNTSNSSTSHVYQSSWTTNSNYELYCDGTKIYFKTVGSTAYLFKDVEYTWEAFG